MRKILVLLGVLVLAALMTSGAFAGGNSNVFATFSVADLGQGVWGGGPLFADGTARGHVAFSAGNGQVIFHLHATSWTGPFGPSPGAVQINFSTHVIKGPPQGAFSAIAPISGTPVLFDFDSDGNPDFVLRVTLAN